MVQRGFVCSVYLNCCPIMVVNMSQDNGVVTASRLTGIIAELGLSTVKTAEYLQQDRWLKRAKHSPRHQRPIPEFYLAARLITTVSARVRAPKNMEKISTTGYNGVIVVRELVRLRPATSSMAVDQYLSGCVAIKI